jgi:hypothetical protein
MQGERQMDDAKTHMLKEARVMQVWFLPPQKYQINLTKINCI